MRLSGPYLEGEDVLRGRLALQHFPCLLLQLVHCCLPSAAGCLHMVDRQAEPLSMVPISSLAIFNDAIEHVQGALVWLVL